MPLHAGYGWNAGASKQVVYTASDGHIHELSVTMDGQWVHADLTEITGAPVPSGGRVDAFAWETGSSKQVVYERDGRIYELSVTTDGHWSYADLTTLTTGTPVGIERMVGYAWESGASKQVVYLGHTDGHIHELSVMRAGAWMHADLTAITGVSGVMSLTAKLNAYAWESESAKQVIYSGGGNIQELSVTIGSNWAHADLTAITGAAVPHRFASVPMGYGWTGGATKQVVFTSDENSSRPGDIYELFATRRGWNYANLSFITRAPTPTGELGNVKGFAWETGGTKQVVYTTLDGHIHELSVPVGGTWAHADLTQLTSAPPVSSGAWGHERFVAYEWEAAKSKQVAYVTGDGHIHELYVELGGRWRHADLTLITGAPPVSP